MPLFMLVTDPGPVNDRPTARIARTWPDRSWPAGQGAVTSGQETKQYPDGTVAVGRA
jgi:hypothetical protein